MGSKSLKTTLTLLLACMLAVPAGLAWFCDCSSHRPAGRPGEADPHACCAGAGTDRQTAPAVDAPASCTCIAQDGCFGDAAAAPVLARTSSSGCTAGPVVCDAPVSVSLPEVHASGCCGSTGPPVRRSDPLLASSPSRAPPRTTGTC